MKKKITVESIKQIRAYGMTYQQIGDYYGVSKQYINQLCPAIRKYDIKKIIYKPIYDIFQQNPDLTISKFCKKIYGISNPKTKNKTERLLKGMNVSLTLKEVENLEKLIGMSIIKMVTQKRY